VFNLIVIANALICLFPALAITSPLITRLSGLADSPGQFIVRVVRFRSLWSRSILVQFISEKLLLQIGLTDFVPVNDEKQNGRNAAGCRKECAGVECKLIRSRYHIDIVC